jgi:hypothetical protein
LPHWTRPSTINLPGLSRSRERAPRILQLAFELITGRREEIALLITLEMCETPVGIEGRDRLRRRVLPLVSEEAVRIAGRYSVASTGGTRLLTMKRPVGPVYAITPLNLSLAMALPDQRDLRVRRSRDSFSRSWSESHTDRSLNKLNVLLHPAITAIGVAFLIPAFCTGVGIPIFSFVATSSR